MGYNLKQYPDGSTSWQNALDANDILRFYPTGEIVLGGASARLATGSKSGSAQAVPAAYSYGEAIELRYTSSKSNTQFQGLYLEVRTAVANTSTIRGAEIKAAQEGAVAVGTLEGLSARADTRSTSTGNVTNMFGLSGETGHNSDAYTGTVTAAAAVRGKMQVEDGTTYTYASIFRADLEAISGAKAIDAVLGVGTVAGATVNSLIDTSALESTNYGTSKQVVLMKFKGANGTVYYLIHDTDSATAVSVATSVS